MAGGFQLKARLKGSAEVRHRLRELATSAPAAIAKALYIVGADVRTEAMIRAPLRFGALRNSAYLTMPSLRDDGPRIEVGFGIVYARYQHEGDFNHPRGGQRYFLRNAVEAKADLSKIAEYARRLLEQGVGPIQVLAPERPIMQRAQRRAAIRRAGARIRRKKE
jgi:hypothetical protein